MPCAMAALGRVALCVSAWRPAQPLLALRCYSSSQEGPQRDDLLYGGLIPKSALTITFARSSGPGGQNVNKVNTKADVRFNVYKADWLPAHVRTKLVEQEGNRINNRGELVVSSTVARTQRANVDDAIARILTMIERASVLPTETSQEQKNHVTKLQKKANEARLERKKLQSSKKAARKGDDW